MERLFNALRGVLPVQALVRLAEERPRFAAWMALSMGICVVLAISGRNASMPLGPWLVLFTVGTLTAGLCIRIVTGDDSGDEGSR